jgi:hypothetical protein
MNKMRELLKALDEWHGACAATSARLAYIQSPECPKDVNGEPDWECVPPVVDYNAPFERVIECIKARGLRAELKRAVSPARE